jgi:hypothetical protein
MPSWGDRWGIGGTWESVGRPVGSNRLAGIGSEVKPVTKSPFHRDSETEVSIVVHVMIWTPTVYQKGAF